MKYIIVVPDGMADKKLEGFGGKTPMEYAAIPFMDSLAGAGELGTARTIPSDMSAGSDIANLSVLGYDPHKYHTGRSPLEAVSLGLELAEDDMVFRCNLVTLTSEPEYPDRKMIDHSAGEIATRDSGILVNCLKADFDTEDFRFYQGVSYRNIMVWKKGPAGTKLIPPHDILEKKIGPYLPRGEGSGEILGLMTGSSKLLSAHPLNRERKDMGFKPANSIWLWGQGRKPYLDSFFGKYGLKGSVISAVDLIRGIGKCAGLDIVEVEGATGTIGTNFSGKAKAAVSELLSGKDFVYIHIEAPDECSHQGDAAEKVRAIELIDREIAGYIKSEMYKSGQDYKLMIIPDHLTPISIRTHSSDPVPFLIYDSTREKRSVGPGVPVFSEQAAAVSGLHFEEGYRLADHFFSRRPIH
ncbi:MAG: cofactor-independent phosphoglycerate mutase [Actinobacteria bacterium]|nr:cofactor-independent phosphoglycerate mutase [Actinomycetota bacterium]